MTDPTQSGGGTASGDWSRFWANGTTMLLSGAVFRATPNRLTGAAFWASIGNFYASTQSPTVRTAFGNQYDRVRDAASAVNQEMLSNPQDFWHPGRRGF
jgi:hypothetical protein